MLICEMCGNEMYEDAFGEGVPLCSDACHDRFMEEIAGWEEQ